MADQPKYTAQNYFFLKEPEAPGYYRYTQIACPYCGESLTFKQDAQHYWLYKCDCAWCPNQAGFHNRTFFRYKHEPDRLYTGYCGW